MAMEAFSSICKSPTTNFSCSIAVRNPSTRLFSHFPTTRSHVAAVWLADFFLTTSLAVCALSPSIERVGANCDSRGNPGDYFILLHPLLGRMALCQGYPSRDYWQYCGGHHLRCAAGQYLGNQLAKDLPGAGIYRIDFDYLRRSVFGTLYTVIDVDVMAGGLAARLDLLKKNLVLSNVAATTGVCFPIGLSYLLLYLGYGYGAVETFIIGAALSATSLGMIAFPEILGRTFNRISGTTFAVISSASETIDLGQTRVGSVLVSAAVIDDVSGLVMSRLALSLAGW